MPPKIAIILPHVTGRGGTEQVINIVMNLLQQESNQYQSILYIFGGSEKRDWLRNVNFKETVFSDNKFIRTFQNISSVFFCMYKFLKEEKPDIVIATHSITCFVVYWIRKITNGRYPIVSWIHFSLNSKNVKKKLLHYADYHFAICPSIKKQFVNINISSKNVYVVNNPVASTNRFIDRPKKEIVFLYVGRIVFEGQKRVKDLLAALSEVEGKWKLIVFGYGDDLQKCQQYSRDLQIEDRIEWKGFVTNPWSHLKQATCLVLTSAYEGMPMVLVEAISRGVYCISSDCETGPRDIIKHRLNGELYEPGNVEALRCKLQEMVSGINIPDQRRIKNTIEQFYSTKYIEKFLESVDDAFEKYKQKQIY